MSNEKKGPFNSEEIDPIVYVQSDIPPELRYDPSKVKKRPIVIRDAAPAAPVSRQHAEWTPGDTISAPAEVKPPTALSEALGRVSRAILAGVMIGVPLVLLGLAVKYGVSLYSK
jgi:hypothetical protein